MALLWAQCDHSGERPRDSCDGVPATSPGTVTVFWRQQSTRKSARDKRHWIILEVDPPSLLCPSWDTFVRHEFESHSKSLADVQNKRVAVGRHDLVGCGGRISARHAI